MLNIIIIWYTDKSFIFSEGGKYMAKLNDNQIKAIKHLDGPLLVISGPGSGKTTVITQRIKYMTQKYHISPNDILTITFTKAAAIEMERRYLAAGRKRRKFFHVSCIILQNIEGIFRLQSRYGHSGK